MPHPAVADFRSSALTGPIIALVKGLHTVIFLVLLGCVVDVTQAAVRGCSGKRQQLALGAVAIEGVIFAANGRTCPLTELVEELGAEKGQVSDIFLPDLLARNIFTISMSLLSFGGLIALVRRLRGHTIPE